MVVNVKNIGKLVIKFLQGSVITQIVLGGITIYRPVANFLSSTCAKNYQNWLRVDKVIVMKNGVVFWPAL